MRVTRVELHNYRQHRDLDVRMDGGMVAVVGPNGSGKSNFLGSIQFALTGEQPPFQKKDLVSWGEDDGAVKVWFSHDGRNGYVLRGINSGKVTLHMDGEKDVSGSRNVENALSERVGLDKDLLRQVVFVRQAEVDSILFDDPRQRELSFQRLLGMGEASKIHDALSVMIQKEEKPQNFDAMIAEEKSKLSRQKEAVEKVEAAISKYSEALSSMPSKEDLDSVCSALSRAGSEVSGLRRDEESMELNMRRAEELEAEVAASGKVPEEEISRMESELSRMKEKAASASRISSCAERLSKSEKDADSAASRISVAVPAKEKAASRLAAVQAEIGSVRGELSGLSGFLSSDALKAGICPLCGGSAEEKSVRSKAEGKISELSVRKASLERELAEASKASAAADSECLSAISWSSQSCRVRDDLRRELSELKAAWKGEMPSSEESSAMVAESESMSRSLESAKASRSACARIRDEAIRCRALAKAAEESACSSRRNLVLVGIPEASDMDAAQLSKVISERDSCMKKCRDSYDSIMADMNRSKGELAFAKSSISDTEKMISGLSKMKEQDSGKAARIEVLKRVRDWFHYYNGPRTLSDSVMEGMSKLVNSFLDQFSAPFVVEPGSEGLSFLCRFTDGRKTGEHLPDACVLSGGEKIMLAVSFRLALYCTFGGKLGLLSLDEPTAYLDDPHIARFGDLLRKVSGIARNMGLQVIMSTHEKGVLDYMDAIVDLGENDTETGMRGSQEG